MTHSSPVTTGLLPCPFCGPGQSMVDPWYDDVSKRWAIGCGRCGASSGRSVHAEGSKESAIKAWNTRASQPARCSADIRAVLIAAKCVTTDGTYVHASVDEVLRALRSVDPAKAVPEGWKLVPVEPTTAQHIAAMEFALDHMKEHGVTALSPFSDYPPLRETTAGMYRAMVGAALPSTHSNTVINRIDSVGARGARKQAEAEHASMLTSPDREAGK